MAQVRPLFNQPTTFSKAYPQVATVRVQLKEEGDYQWQGQLDRVFDKSSIPTTVPCANPRCKQGGYAIDQMVYFMVQARKTKDEHTISCYGHEGSPKGRRKGMPCSNYAKIKIDITYADQSFDGPVGDSK